MKSEGGDHNLRDWLTLHLAPGLGAATCRRLVEQLGSPRAVLEAGQRQLASLSGIRPAALAALTGGDRDQRDDQTDRELEAAGRLGIKIVTLDNPVYPERLRHIHSPPLVLYVKGLLDTLNTPGIAIVGSRAASSYGRRVAAKMSHGLAGLGFTVISGLALGIDSEAHQAAMEADGRTIAVLGCGLDVLYPSANRRLFERIPTAGALVSEYPLGTKPDSFRFPARNRIISGLALGVLIVEASQRSGSLITAQHALEQGREVFAVPGQVDSVKSAGAHTLVQQGAKLVQSVADIVEELSPTGPYPAGDREKSATPLPQMSAAETELLAFLEVYPRPIDEIVRASGLAPQKVSELLLMLELKDVVEAQPGQCYRRKT